MFPFHFCSQPVCVLESQRLIIWKLPWRFAHPNRPGQKHPDTWASCMPTRLTLSPSHLLILIRLLLKNIFLKIKWILFPIVFYLLLQISYSFLFDIWNFLLQISAKKKPTQTTQLFWCKCVSSTETVSCLLDELSLRQTTPVYSQISWDRRASFLIPQPLRGHNTIALTWQVLRKCFLIVEGAAP